LVVGSWYESWIPAALDVRGENTAHGRGISYKYPPRQGVFTRRLSRWMCAVKTPRGRISSKVSPVQPLFCLKIIGQLYEPTTNNQEPRTKNQEPRTIFQNGRKGRIWWREFSFAPKLSDLGE
jgi:hypothetical protein